MNENQIITEKITINTEHFLDALDNRNAQEVKKLTEEIYPIDLAILINGFDDEELKYFIDLTNDEKMSEILEQSDEDSQERILLNIDTYRIIYLFNYMSKDDIVDALGALPVFKRKEIINLMKTGERKIIENLLGYEQDTAGGIMTTEYIAVNSNLTIDQTIQKIKEIAPKTEVIDTIFILDEKRQLTGTIDLREIFISSNQTKLSDIMNSQVISVFPETDQEEVSLLVSKYDLKTIPVINRNNYLLGIITVDDIVDVIIEEHTEDILKLGGVNKEENINNSVFQSVKMRLPWLCVNLATAFLASFTVGIFEGTIEKVVALAAAMPIVAGMGGNAGTQTLSIVIRSIALGEAKLKDSIRLLKKEFFLGIINGAIIGILTGIILYFKYNSPYLGLIIFIAMVCNLIIAGIFGVIVPLILKALKADPAIASSVFLTTATDVFGFFIFLGLSQLLLPLLI